VKGRLHQLSLALPELPLAGEQAVATSSPWAVSRFGFDSSLVLLENMFDGRRMRQQVMGKRAGIEYAHSVRTPGSPDGKSEEIALEFSHDP